MSTPASKNPPPPASKNPPPIMRAGLRKLLEAKDCLVRAQMDTETGVPE